MADPETFLPNMDPEATPHHAQQQELGAEETHL